MRAIHLTATALDEGERNARVHAGEIILFRGFTAVYELVDLLRARCRAYLGDVPERAHERMAPAELDAAAESLRQAVLADAAVAEAVRIAFAEIGVDLRATYGDGLKQRVQMAADARGQRLVAPLGVHRDTWGSNVAAQTNWWAPVYPVTPERTLALFPAYFDRPVANDSAGWDFRELVRRLRAEGRDADYPLLPLATDPPGWDEAVPISPEPGDLLCFSGAHLHASVPNTTGRTRLSCEIRTVNGDDAAAGRGAPNVDGAALRTTWQLFRHLSDGRKLGEMEPATASR